MAKFVWPTTTSAGASFAGGIRFQMRIRLWLVSATTRCTPSEATAVGWRMLDSLAARFMAVVRKSGWPRTTDACPTQTGHLVLGSNWSVGRGRALARFENTSTRLLEGNAPRRLSSTTKSVLLA